MTLASDPNPTLAKDFQMVQALTPPVLNLSAWIIASLASKKEGLQGCNFIPSTMSWRARVFPCLGTRGVGLAESKVWV